jgi:hypothetical protein
LQSDIDDLEIGDTQNADRRRDGVRGDRLRLVIEFARFETYTQIPTMETIQMDFEVGDDIKIQDWGNVSWGDGEYGGESVGTFSQTVTN